MSKEIQLTQGRVAIVDDDMYEPLMEAGHWLLHKHHQTFYARRIEPKPGGGRARIRMHREIFRLKGLELPPLIDHQNGNGLDNRMDNLRAATNQQNRSNSRKRLNCSSQYKGVCLENGKWRAGIHVGNKKTYLGHFNDEIDAAIAYDRAALMLYGPFARLNFPDAFLNN